MTVATTTVAAARSCAVSAGDTVRDPAVTALKTAWTAATDGSGVANIVWAGRTAPRRPCPRSLPTACASGTIQRPSAKPHFGLPIRPPWTSRQHAPSKPWARSSLMRPLRPTISTPTTGLGGVYRGWMDSGCRLVGADYEVARYAPDGSALNVVQKFYMTWDAANLRLAWTGADWRGRRRPLHLSGHHRRRGDNSLQSLWWRRRSHYPARRRQRPNWQQITSSLVEDGG